MRNAGAIVEKQETRVRLLLVLASASALAAVDLFVKLTLPTPEWAFHQRSDEWVALSLLLLVGAAALARVPSRAVAVAAGVMSGGVLGNLVSAMWDGNRVPNPFVIGNPFVGGIAFNLADVTFFVGNLVLTVALVGMTIRNRDRLIPPRRLVRALYLRARG